MSIDPNKIKLFLVEEDDYHLKAGEIVKVYWNEDMKKYKTTGRTYLDKFSIGNWEPTGRVITEENDPEFFI